MSDEISVYADLQFHKTDNSQNQYVVKEFATLRNNCELTHYVFEPPTDFTLLTRNEQKQVRWLEKNHHSIPWNAGFVPYKYVSRVITKDLQSIEKIYVKGLDKIRFLEKLDIRHAINIEDLGIQFRIKDIISGIKCLNHNNPNNNICALSIIFTIKTYMEFKNVM